MIGKRCPTFEKKVVAFEKDEFSRTWLAKPKVINIKNNNSHFPWKQIIHIIHDI